MATTKSNTKDETMFDFNAVARISQELNRYAESQQGWIKSGMLGDKSWKAEKRMRKAAAAAKALRAFLHSSEAGEESLQEVLAEA